MQHLNEIIEPNHRIQGHGIYVTDIMHVFKANNPASQLGSGQQKNGYYFCWKLPKHCLYHFFTKHISSCSYKENMFDKCKN